MKAAVLHGVGDLVCEQVPIPELGEKDVLVKVSACGVCGSTSIRNRNISFPNNSRT